jgi:hypothetical protein
MADIKLDIDVSSIAKAKKALKDFSNQSDKLGRSVMAAGKKVQSVSSGWAEANKMYKQGVLNSKQLSQAQVELARELAVINGYTKKNGSLNTDRALRELKAAEAAKDNARATQEAADAARKQAREIDRLKGKFVANYGASQKYKKEIRDLIRAKRQGIVTTDQYGDAVQRLKSDFRDVQNGVARGSNQFASYNTATYRANQSTKRFASVGLQQAGYQVGDFAVQLQGGTNAAVAFGQQGSQLLGIFGPLGAVMGAALAVATAFAAPLLDMAEASDKAGQSLKNFEDATKSAKESISDMRFELEALNAGFLDTERFALDTAMREAQAEVARTEATVERLKQAVEDSDTSTSGRGADRLSTLRTQLALEQASLEAAKEELEEYIRLTNEIKEGKSQLIGFGDVLGFINGETSSVVAKFSGILPEVSPVQAKLLEMNQTLNDTTGINLAGVFQDAKNWSSQLLGDVQLTAMTLNNLKDVTRDTTGRGDAMAELRRRREDQSGNITNLANLPDIPIPTSAPGSGGGGGGAAQAAQEVEKLNDSLSRNQQLLKDVGKTMSQSFGDALMSVVDGSKSAADAFKDMARQILKQAFDMLVVKPIMDSIMGFFGGGQISGPSFGTGSRANFAPPPRPFADGGVVNGPTVFPMANGTGLMGEAGPEAIMPLKRGKNGKLGVQSEGGQGNVTVENHFHISANGDDSVKRIIQQEAPKIANYTQQQILDQRRRGGAMKSTFGG